MIQIGAVVILGLLGIWFFYSVIAQGDLKQWGKDAADGCLSTVAIVVVFALFVGGAIGIVLLLLAALGVFN
ncbi:hypothetical protein BH20ACI2_BH20ACI2_23460 [soil metagenome]